jgi:hypothetical protein
MAKILSAVNDVAGVIENPAASNSDTMFLYGAGYNKASITPKWDSHFRGYDAANVAKYDYQNNTTMSGYSGVMSTTVSTAGTDTYCGNAGYGMALSGDTGYARQSRTTSNSNSTNNSDNVATVVQNSYYRVMDPTARTGAMSEWTSTNGDKRVIWQRYSWLGATPTQIASWKNPGELDVTNPDFNQNESQRNYSNYNWSNNYMKPHNIVHYHAASDKLVFLSHGSNGYVYTEQSYDGYGNFSFDTMSYTQTLYAQNYTTQYIGASANDDTPFFFKNNIANDYQQYVNSYNPAANTQTVAHQFTTAPSAAEQSYGGTRTNTSLALSPSAKFASMTFADFTSGAASGDKGFYVPYFDTSFNYFPFYYRWNASTDAFTREQATSVTGDLSSVHHLDATQAGNTSYSFGRQTWWNDTLVSSGTRYLTLFSFNGYNNAYSGAEKARTFVTYSCGATDPTALTHHSAVIIPATPRGMVYLNDAKTIMGVFCNDAFYVYGWNNSTGWTLASSIPGTFHQVGRDSLGRIWGMEKAPGGGIADVHLLSVNLPYSVSITPAATSYNYSGSNIATNVAVSAYGVEGTRLAVGVNLSITGSTMNFDSAGGPLVKTVTTSTSADVTQNVTITGAGLSDITANVSI